MTWKVYRFIGEDHFINHQNMFLIEIKYSDLWADHGDGKTHLGYQAMVKKMPDSVRMSSQFVCDIDPMDYPKFVNHDACKRHGFISQDAELKPDEDLREIADGVTFKIKRF